MHLGTISQILTRDFLNEVAKHQKEPQKGLRFKGAFNKKNIELVQDVPVYHQICASIPKDNLDVRHPQMNVLMEKVGSNPLKLMIAMSVAWQEKLPNANAAFLNFKQFVLMLEDSRLRQSRFYNALIFEYIWISVGWVYKERMTIEPGIIERTILEHADEGKAKVWRILNEKAKLDLDARDFNRHEDDRLYNDYWLATQRRRIE